MIKKPLIVLSIMAASLVPTQAIATTLDEISAQIESNGFVAGAGGQPNITLDDLRTAQSETPTQQPRQITTGSRPDPIGSASSGINRTLDTGRLIDPITGRIDGAIDGVTGRVNGAIDRALNGLLSPVDGAIDGVFGKVDGVINNAIASVMAPVDKVINDLMASLDKQIENLLGGLLGDDGAVGGVIDEATGGIFGGIFGGGGRNTVEAAYNPTSPLTSIISATSFQAGLSGITAPYTEAIPFAIGSMGLPDYSKIMPTLDALAKGENGNPNSILQGADRYSTTPETLKMSISGEVERLGSRSIAQATLSEAGQDDMKSDLEGATKTLETIIQLGDDSQDMDVTQDVMKNLTAQLANDSVIRTGQYKQDMLARQQAAADAIVNAEIAQLLSEQNRSSRADVAANAARMHAAVGQLHLPGEMADD